MNFEIILLSSPDRVEDEVTTVVTLFEKGLTTFHIRKPTWTEAEVAQYIRMLPEQYHSRLVLHAHYPLANEYNLKGIHLTERSQQDKATLAYLKKLKGKAISASFHQLSQVVRHRRKYHYVFLSPIFDSISKQEYPSNFSLNSLRESWEALKKRRGYIPKVVALGGIEADNVRAVQEAGFAGVALLGTIWQSTDPVAAFLAIQRIGILYEA